MKTMTAATYEARLIHLGAEDARQCITEFEAIENDGSSTIVDLDSLWSSPDAAAHPPAGYTAEHGFLLNEN